MLTGKQLGEAIKQAIKLKIDSGAVASKADIARHFGIKAPSIYDWINKGSISKDKLPELWRYFSDVVGMDHWGLQGAAARMAAETGVMPDEIKEPSALAGDYAALTPELIPPRKVPVEGTAQLGDDGYWSRLEGNTDGFVLAWSRDENAYALRCKGDSMQPRIQDGEFVVIEPNTEPRPGDEVLIQHADGRVMVKRFLYERDGRYHVMSINQAHPPQSFARETIDRFYPVVAIVKKVFWVPE